MTKPHVQRVVRLQRGALLRHRRESLITALTRGGRYTLPQTVKDTCTSLPADLLRSEIHP